MTKQEAVQVKTALCLHKSMAECGEKPSLVSDHWFQLAIRILDKQIFSDRNNPAVENLDTHVSV